MRYLYRMAALLCIPVLFFMTGCSYRTSSSQPLTYTETIAEGRAAVKEIMAAAGATAISVALTDGDRMIWNEAFGNADMSSGRSAVASTMFSDCSVSKMFAAVAVMKLVDQGKVSLDAPLGTYLPDFRMDSPSYTDITVRMLLNHSAGLPGGDMRNAGTPEPYTGFAAQVMADLKQQRLKHTPGYMSVYSNDGFTMIENLVKAVSGKSYPQFVQDEILSPLGMTNSRYAVQKLDPVSYAKPHTGQIPNEPYSLNMYATGGLYTTAEDMARLGAMLINGGVYNNRRVLTARSIAAMAQDQTLGSFNPLPSNFMRFGLGWDSVAAGGFDAVGIKAWQKGGDMSGEYGTMFVVLPEERLAVMVMGASNGAGSEQMLKIAERTLLKALVERGRLTAMPTPLDGSVQLPLHNPPDQDTGDVNGYYADHGTVYQATLSGNALSITKRGKDGSWSAMAGGLLLRNDGWYAASGDAVKAFRSLAQEGRRYLAVRFRDGLGHYSSTAVLAQKLAENRAQISDAWKARSTEQWLPVNDAMAAIGHGGNLSLSTTNLPPGYLSVNGTVLSDMPTPVDDRLDGMILLIPQTNGRDLNDLVVSLVAQEKWLLFGSTLYRPESGISTLDAGQSSVTIGNDGYMEWRRLPATGSLTINGATAWQIFDGTFQPLLHGTGNGGGKLSGSKGNYLMLYGAPGLAISMTLTI